MLTEKELEIMKVLWNNGGLTCNEIITLTENNRTWKENSIFVILKSMLNKGYIEVTDYKPTQTRNAKVYSPTLSREEYAVEQSRSLDVSTAQFLLAFIKQKEIQRHETEELLKLLLEKIQNED